MEALYQLSYSPVKQSNTTGGRGRCKIDGPSRALPCPMGHDAPAQTGPAGRSPTIQR